MPARPDSSTATAVVALSMLTSATAHLEAGGALPDLPGCSALLLLLALLWLASHRLAHRRGGIFAALCLGQLAGHLGYQAGTLGPPDVVVSPGAVSTIPHGMNRLTTSGAMDHSTMHAGMAGMDHGSAGPLAMPPAMLANHLAAAAISALLLLALGHLAAHLGTWLHRVRPVTLTPLLVTPVFRALCHVVLRPSRWALPAPPPQRGPPVLV